MRHRTGTGEQRYWSEVASLGPGAESNVFHSARRANSVCIWRASGGDRQSASDRDRDHHTPGNPFHSDPSDVRALGRRWCGIRRRRGGIATDSRAGCHGVVCDPPDRFVDSEDGGGAGRCLYEFGLRCFCTYEVDAV